MKTIKLDYNEYIEMEKSIKILQERNERVNLEIEQLITDNKIKCIIKEIDYFNYKGNGRYVENINYFSLNEVSQIVIKDFENMKKSRDEFFNKEKIIRSFKLFKLIKWYLKGQPNVLTWEG